MPLADANRTQLRNTRRSVSRSVTRRRTRTRQQVRSRLVEAAVETVRADPRLSLPREQQEGASQTRTRRRQSRRRERIAREAQRVSRQFGPTSGPEITPRAARAMGDELRAQRASRRAEARRDLSAEERAELPGSVFRTDSYDDYQLRVAEAEATNQAGLGGALEGIANVLTLGTPSAIRAAVEDPSLYNISMAGLALTPGKVLGAPVRVATIPLRRAIGPAARLAGLRSMTYRGLEEGFRSSPSIITATGQRMLDKFSEGLGRSADRLRAPSSSRVAQAAGRAITPLSTRARVPSRAGTLQSVEAGRRRAERAVELRTIAKAGRGERTAHFWWAQLPAAQRNAQGLQLVRNRIAAEQSRYASGQVTRQLEQRLDEINDALKSPGADRWVLMRERESVRALLADIPRVIADQGDELKKLDKLIAKPPKLNDNIIMALDVLAQDRRNILTAAGKLTDDRANARAGIVSRWLGLEETGEEIYLGHRMGEVRGARASLLPGGVGTGKTRLPQGAATQNKLQLVAKGRARTDLETAIDDWQAAQVYEFQNAVKDDLARMGEEVNPFAGIPDGYYVINPQGNLIPRSLRQGADIELDEIEDMREYVSNTVAKSGTADAQKMLAQAEQYGTLSALRQVPADVVNRYFSHMIDPKILVMHPTLKAPSTFGKGVDAVNDLVYLSLIYSNPGYIPSNLVGNLVFAGLDQGAFLIPNLYKAGQILAHASPSLRKKILNEIGPGPTIAVTSGAATRASRAISAPARVASRIADVGPRVSAWVHAAGKVGVLNPYKPALTKADFQKLEGLFGKSNRRLLNDIKENAEEAMVRFDNLSPLERSVAKRVLFVWPWIRGATRYPFVFAKDHPLRSAAIAYGAYEYQDEIRARMLNNDEMPPWLQNTIKTGKKVVDGKTYPMGLPTNAISPISTAYGTISSAIGRPGANTLVEFLNPALRSAYQIASRETPYGQEADSYRDAAAQAGERIAPQFGLTQDLINPPDDTGMYPGDSTRLGRLARASRVVPYPINTTEAKKSHAREYRSDKSSARQEPLKFQVLSQWALESEQVGPQSKAAIRKWRRMEAIIRERTKQLAEREGKNFSDLDGTLEQYTIKLQVLKRVRPEVLNNRALRTLREDWLDVDLQEKMKTQINDWIEFADEYDGVRLSTAIERHPARLGEQVVDQVGW